MLLTKHDGEVSFSAMAFSKDGKTLLLTSDEGGEFASLYAMDLGKPGAAKRVIAHPDWDAEDAGFSSTSKYFHTVTNARPLLVVQGDHDARVKKDQSDRIVAGLQKRNVPVHYLVLANEGHGFSKTENNLAAYRATDRFLDRYVWGDTSADVIAKDK